MNQLLGRYIVICFGTALAYLFGIIVAIVMVELLQIPKTLSGQIFFFAHSFAVLVTGTIVYLAWLKWPYRSTLFAAALGMLIFIAAVLSVNIHLNAVDQAAASAEAWPVL